MTSRFLILFLAVALLFPASQALAQPERSWIEFFFPRLQSPSDSDMAPTHAPFAPLPEPGRTENAATAPLLNGDDLIPVDQPHRQAAQLSEWVAVAVASALTFESGNPNDTLQKIVETMDESARREYLAFLKASGLQPIILSDQNILRSYVEEWRSADVTGGRDLSKISDARYLVNQGVVDGRYRWLFRVPVALTVLDRHIRDYKQAAPQNYKGEITLQIGRVSNAPNEHSVRIESWQGNIRSAAPD